MNHHQQIGKIGEDLACRHLAEKDYQILERNWRFSRYEVDIIAQRGDILHIIEVKTRTSMHFGYPEDNLGRQKLKFLARAADAYLEQYPQWKKIQFDVVAISIKKNSTTEIVLLEDIYW